MSKVLKILILDLSNKLSNLLFLNLYKGFSLHLISNLIYWTSSLLVFDKLNKQDVQSDKNIFFKLFNVFKVISFNAISVSLLIYPLDTLKRYLQVNSSLGFNTKFNSLKEAYIYLTSDNIKLMYSGLSVYMIRTLLFSILHYTIYCSIVTIDNKLEI